MVGLIHKILFDLVASTAGPEAVQKVKEAAGVPASRKFRMDEAYDDDEWRRILSATCDVLRLSQEEVEDAYADFFLEDSMKRWPMWFSMSGNSYDFLLRQPKIHNGFATGVPHSHARRMIADKFELEDRDGEITMHYRSPNHLCGLYKALARRIIRHYEDQASIDEERCLKNGDEECTIHIRWGA